LRDLLGRRLQRPHTNHRRHRRRPPPLHLKQATHYAAAAIEPGAGEGDDAVQPVRVAAAHPVRGLNQRREVGD
jgi:hypothetical protein